MKKPMTLLFIAVISLAVGIGIGVRIGSNYSTYREAMGMFPVHYSLYRDAELSTKDRTVFQIHSRGELQTIAESSWISRQAYRFLNPPYGIDPTSGDFEPLWFEARGEVEPSGEQLKALQSLFDHELANETPSLEELRSIVVLHDFSISLRNE